MPSVVSNSSLARFWYGAAISEFMLADSEAILGSLSRNSDSEVVTTQRDAWLAQIDILRTQLAGSQGWLFFEFNIPRMGRRVDVVLVLRSVIFALEFKVGGKAYDRAD